MKNRILFLLFAAVLHSSPAYSVYNCAPVFGKLKNCDANISNFSQIQRDKLEVNHKPTIEPLAFVSFYDYNDKKELLGSADRFFCLIQTAGVGSVFIETVTETVPVPQSDGSVINEVRDNLYMNGSPGAKGVVSCTNLNEYYCRNLGSHPYECLDPE